MPDEARQELLHRLKSSQGHLSAVIRMVENQVSCEEVLHHLCAIQGALRIAGCQLLDQNTEHFLKIIRSNSTPEEKILALENLISLSQVGRNSLWKLEPIHFQYSEQQG